MENTTLTITPIRSALLAGHHNETHVLVRVRAAEANQGEVQRQPLNLSLVIDRSGSMAGDPLRQAVRCARFMIDSMHPEDQASLVIYDDHVDILVPSSPVGDRSRFHKALLSFDSRGCTALFDGWFEGAGQAAQCADSNAISRVLLLSDGCANSGPSTAEDIGPRCAEMAESGVTTSTYGLGHHFNETLMGEMATSGLGSCYYGESAEDLMDPFREEFDLLSALCSRHLRLRLKAPRGVDVELLNGYRRDSKGRWMLPDLAHGADVWALVKLSLPVKMVKKARARELLVLDATLDYTDVHGAGQQSMSAALALPVLDAAGFNAIAEDQTVKARIQEIESAQVQDKIREAALSQDWDRVDRLLEKARAAARDNPWLEEGIASLERYARQRQSHTLSKEAYYRSSKLRSRRVSSLEVLSDYAPMAEQDIPSYLRRKREEGKRMDRKDDNKD